MCKRDAETSDHPLLSFLFASSLWRRLLRETQVSWDNPTSSVALSCERYKLVGGKRGCGARENCYVGNSLDGVDGEE